MACLLRAAYPAAPIRVLCTSKDGFPEGVVVGDPSEDTVKSLFEEGLDSFGVADPLVIYWSGHGALPHGALSRRRLFYGDTSSSNVRNLDFDSLVGRLVSEHSAIRSLILVVDACAVGADGRFWPTGDIVGGRPRRREEGFLERVVLFSASPNEPAMAGTGSTPPLYTELLLAELGAQSDDDEDLLAWFRSAHAAVTKRLVGDVTRLAQAWGKRPEELAHQLPFEILEWTAGGKATVRPAFAAGIVTPENATEVAIVWASAYASFGENPDFASTPAQRDALAPYQHEIFAYPQVKKWWTAGARRDSRNKWVLGGVATAALVLLLCLIYFLAWHPVERFVADLRDQHDVKEQLEARSQLTKFLSPSLLKSIVADDREVSDKRERLAHARHRANCAIALLLRGEDQDVLDFLAGYHKEWFDPQARTYATLYAGTPGGVDSEKLLETVQGNGVPPLAKQAIILMLGQPGVITLSKHDQRQRLKTFLLDAVENDDDPAVHAAALWCFLGKFADPASGRELAEVFARLREQGTERLALSRGERHWFVDHATGLTMVVILVEGHKMLAGDRDQRNRGSSSYPHRIVLDRAFAISMTEITDEHLNGAAGAEMCHARPRANLSRKDADDICDQLDAMAGGEAAIEIADSTFTMKSWRLPDESEWEYACRGGSLAAFSFGDDAGDGDWILYRHATVVPRSQKAPLLLQRMPNGFGLFDVHGGAAEWCLNDFGPLPVDQDRVRIGSAIGVLRGGSGFRGDGPNEHLASFARSDAVYDVSPTRRESGLRVVRSFVLSR